MIWILLLPIQLLAQSTDELNEIDRYKDLFPGEELQRPSSEFKRDHYTKYKPPYSHIPLAQIQNSETEYGHLKANAPLIRLKDGKEIRTTKEIYTQAHRLEDEFGFRYLVNKEGQVVYKVAGRNFTSIRHEMVLYEPPHEYTPAPKNKIIKRDFDTKLKILPEFSFSVGMVQGNYMKDLFNDEKTSLGLSTQYAATVFTDWNLPVKFGLVAGYERSSYSLSAGGKINYSSFNFGPQFRTKDLSLWDHPIRIQAQFRYGPFARLTGEMPNGNVSFKFHSADFIVGIDRPIKNGWGEFAVGLFMHNQWLNMKDQPEIVKVSSSSEINRSIGLSFSQVFE